MRPFFVVLSIGCLWCLTGLQGCSSGDASSKAETAKAAVSEESESTAETAPESAAAESKTVSVSEPVDPQAEVKEAFEKLLAIRTEPDPDEWQAADKKLVAFGKTAVPTLKEGLTHTDPGARELASMYLASLGPDAEAAAPALVEVLSDESPFTQVNAASTLTHFPKHRDKAIPVLIELTRHSDPNTRLTAVYSLGNLEEHSTAQVEAIQ
ncbi:MAG: HEAT repeat domain-containing protein, partial [Gimesia chilikensis]